MAATLELDAARAFANRKNPNSNWTESLPDADGGVWPSLKPSFSFSRSATVFTVGSCFARNVERALGKLGCRVPMLDFKTREEEWEGRPASMLNKFTPPNFKESIEWTAKVFDRDGIVRAEDCVDYALDLGDGTFIDLDVGSKVAVSFERFVERRQEIYDVFCAAFHAEVVVMTPGYVETWLDTKTGLHMRGVLKVRAAFRLGSRFKFELRSYEDCRADLLAAIDIVRARNGKSKILITTSPVPLSTTFSGQDVRIANAYSKSIIRAACGDAAAARPLADYFPSYEAAILSHPAIVWKEDRVHVQPGFVEKIANHLAAAYIEDFASAGAPGPASADAPTAATAPVAIAGMSGTAYELGSDGLKDLPAARAPVGGERG